MRFRSLYLRIGLGFIALLALLLIVQALLVIWLTGPAGGWLPVRTPARLATVVASEISSAVTGKCGDMEGVWIEPVTAQVMMTLRTPFCSRTAACAGIGTPLMLGRLDRRSLDLAEAATIASHDL